eukprot:PhM_4_TR3148/c0_g1_i1/m.86716
MQLRKTPREVKATLTTRPAWIDPTRRSERPRPWHISNLPHLLQVLQSSKRVEERLHAASTLRKLTADTRSNSPAMVLRGAPDFITTVVWVVSADAGLSAPARRCQVHMLHALRNMCGVNNGVDARLCHDEDLLCCLLDGVIHSGRYEHEAVVTAMDIISALAEHVPENQSLLCHRTDFVQNYVTYLTTSTDGHVVFYALQTIYRISQNSKTHFFFAHAEQLLEVVFIMIESASEDVERCRVALRFLLNVMSSAPEHALEVLRRLPSLADQAMEMLHGGGGLAVLVTALQMELGAENDNNNNNRNHGGEEDRAEQESLVAAVEAVQLMCRDILSVVQEHHPGYMEELKRMREEMMNMNMESEEEQHPEEEEREEVVVVVNNKNNNNNNNVIHFDPTTTLMTTMTTPKSPPSTTLATNISRTATPPPPASATIAGLQQFIDQRIQSLEALYGRR